MSHFVSLTSFPLFSCPAKGGGIYWRDRALGPPRSEDHPAKINSYFANLGATLSSFQFLMTVSTWSSFVALLNSLGIFVTSQAWARYTERRKHHACPQGSCTHPSSSSLRPGGLQVFSIKGQMVNSLNSFGFGSHVVCSNYSTLPPWC